MKSLSNLRLSTPPPADEARLTRWLQEWTADALLSEDPAALDDDRQQSAAPHDTNIQAADIRLLAPTLSRHTHARPVHLLVLEHAPPGHTIVVPFSRFSTPALPGELAIETDIPALRVLCLWNRCRMSTAVLQASWRVTRLPPAIFTECLTRPPANDSTAAPPGLSERVGPPLSHPLDPRHRYIDAEMELCQALELLSDSSAIAYPPPPDETSLDKAAEPPPDYDA